MERKKVGRDIVIGPLQDFANFPYKGEFNWKNITHYRKIESSVFIPFRIAILVQFFESLVRESTQFPSMQYVQKFHKALSENTGMFSAFEKMERTDALLHFLAVIGSTDKFSTAGYKYYQIVKNFEESRELVKSFFALFDQMYHSGLLKRGYGYESCNAFSKVLEQNVKFVLSGKKNQQGQSNDPGNKLTLKSQISVFLINNQAFCLYENGAAPLFNEEDMLDPALALPKKENVNNDPKSVPVAVPENVGAQPKLYDEKLNAAEKEIQPFRKSEEKLKLDSEENINALEAEFKRYKLHADQSTASYEEKLNAAKNVIQAYEEDERRLKVQYAEKTSAAEKEIKNCKTYEEHLKAQYNEKINAAEKEVQAYKNNEAKLEVYYKESLRIAEEKLQSYKLHEKQLEINCSKKISAAEGEVQAYRKNENTLKTYYEKMLSDVEKAKIYKTNNNEELKKNYEKKLSDVEKELIAYKERDEKTLEKLQYHIKELDEKGKALKDLEETCKIVLAENEKLNLIKNKYDVVERSQKEAEKKWEAAQAKKEEEYKKVTEELQNIRTSLEKEAQIKIDAKEQECMMKIRREKEALDSVKNDYEQKLRNLDKEQEDLRRIRSELEASKASMQNAIEEKEKKLNERDANLQKREEEKTASIYGLALTPCRICSKNPPNAIFECKSGHMVCTECGEKQLAKQKCCGFCRGHCEKLRPIFYT